MIRVDIWVKITGNRSDGFLFEEKYMNLIFFGGLFCWQKFIKWEVYTHDFSDI